MGDSGADLNRYVTWYKTVSSWIRNTYGKYLIEVSPGPERYDSDYTHKYLEDCSSSSCTNQYAIVPYNKIDLLALHADAWTDKPNSGDFNPCASLQRAVSNWSKPVIMADDGMSAFPERNQNGNVSAWAQTSIGTGCSGIASGIGHFDHIEGSNKMPQPLPQPADCTPTVESANFMDCQAFDVLGDVSTFSNLCSLAGSSCQALSQDQWCRHAKNAQGDSCWVGE